MPDERYAPGDRVAIYLDSPRWKSKGWFPGTVVRVDPYSGHRDFTWVELDMPVMDMQGGLSSIVSVLNPKNIKRFKST